MKKLTFLTVLLTIATLVMNAQTKKDGTPDMRYKSNKEMFGNSYTIPSYSSTIFTTSSYSTPSYSTFSYPETSYSLPSFPEPKQERNYINGGQLRIQDGYFKSNGTYVEPHLKTTPDNIKWNNLSLWDF